MESDNEILGLPSKDRCNMMDTPGNYNFTSSLPQRSRSMMNLSNAHSLRRHTWLLPESRTVAEKQSQLTKRRGFSGALSTPPPKTPSIGRYLEVFKKLKAAYSCFSRSWDEVDRSSLSIKDSQLFDKTKKKLVARLQKIEDLYDLYVHQDHMRKGAQKLLDTIERDSSKKVKSGKHYCKMNLKKNLTRLCDVENEINDLAGSIEIQIIGLIGFARLSPGDVYSVQLRHGNEKLNTKCKIVGQAQKWTISELTLKANPANDLILKVSEVRTVNTNAVGEVTCPITNFLSPEGQEFVLPVNSTGSLKLKISAFWNPFSTKTELALYSKLNIPQAPLQRLDSLSDRSLTPSPCSTPRNGTLSSMPRVMSNNGTLSSVRISVNGTQFSSQASVFKPSKVDNGSINSGDSLKTLLAIKSLPDIAKSCEEESAIRERFEISKIIPGSYSPINNNKGRISSQNQAASPSLSNSIALRDSESRRQRKLRPVTMSPTFTNGVSYQSDYENIVNLISTSILGDKPDLIPQEDTTPKSKKRPKSVAVPYKPVPIPDYPLDFSPRNRSPEVNRSNTMPIIDEPDYSPPPQLDAPQFRPFPPPPSHPAPEPPSFSEAEEGETPVAAIITTLERVETMDESTNLNQKSNTEENATVHQSSAADQIDSSTVVVNVTKTEPAVTEANNICDKEIAHVGGDSNNDYDDLLREVRAQLLDSMVKCNQFDADIQDRVTSLKSVLEDISLLLQEKKEAVTRTSSIENALNSIDSAFDFLSEHQTMKPDKKKAKKNNNEVCPNSWKVFKKVLRHHLKGVQYAIEKLLLLESPLGVKRQFYLEKLSAEAEVLQIISMSLASDDSVSPKDVASPIDRTKLAGIIWEKHCSKDELVCKRDQMKLVLNHMYLQFKQDSKPSDEVCEEILERIIDSKAYGKEYESITLFQFATFISRIKSLSEYFDTVSKEKKFQKAIQSRDDLLIMSVMQERQAIPITPNVLKLVASLLNAENKTVQIITVDFLTKLSMDKKKKAIDIYLTMVEDDDANLRAAVCTALKCLEAYTAQETIVYLWKNDIESVRTAASDALEVIGFPAGMGAGISNKNAHNNEVSTQF